MGYFRLLRTNLSGLRTSEVGALYMKIWLRDIKNIEQGEGQKLMGGDGGCGHK